MLQQLIVHHYTLVDFLHLDFSHKMTAISGETGAGKSILLGALGLTLAIELNPVVFAKALKRLTSTQFLT